MNIFDVEKSLPVAYSVTVAEVKKQLNIETDFIEDDSFISSLIEVATEFVQGEINADVELTNNSVVIESASGVIEIKEAPFVSMTSVEDEDENSVEGVGLRASGWNSFFVRSNDGTPDWIKIKFVTGYSVLPPALKQAIILKAAALYDSERSDSVVGVSVAATGAINGLLRKFKRTYY